MLIRAHVLPGGTGRVRHLPRPAYPCESASSAPEHRRQARNGGTATLQLDNPFWRFSLRVYAAQGVQQACLRLQDDFGTDVNLLLLAAWLGAVRHQSLGAADLAEAPGTRWDAQAIKPLRAARREAKAVAGDGAALADFYRQIQACELRAEQIRQAWLFQWADGRFPWRDAPRQTRENLCIILGKVAAHEASAISRLTEAAEALAADA
jgi:uncharacterized protein (TIGR02444 family)